MGLRKFRKLKPKHFDERLDRSQKMKVALVAQVLSATMVHAIDTVCSNSQAGIFPREVPFAQRKELLSKVRKLCKKMNRWFDLCNSKDPNMQKDWRIKLTPRSSLHSQVLSSLERCSDGHKL
jgi:ADP-heptose:LPS heptosyltransferase